MTNDTRQALPLIFPDWPAPPWVKAVTTTRQGGFSRSPYDHFNLGQYVGENADTVQLNQQLLESLLSVGNIQWIKQVHGVDVVNIGNTAQTADAASAIDIDKTGGVSSFKQVDMLIADGCYTQNRNTACALVTADCLPILITDKRGTKVAALHAGWRGLAAGIIGRGFRAANINPAEALVWLGPAIGASVYEVGDEVRQAFINASADPHFCVGSDAKRYSDSIIASNFISTRKDHYLCNMVGLARSELEHMGVLGVYGGDHCTYSDPEQFYSFRRDGNTGRFASLIWIGD